MQEIQKKIAELEKLLNDFKPTPGQQRAHGLVKSYISLAAGAAEFKSRIKPGGSELAEKLNSIYKDHEPKPEKKKKRGRPKKEKENVLAISTAPKTLNAKLKKDAKK
jgi:hypothetical protein